jgi:hypothetical protein
MKLMTKIYIDPHADQNSNIFIGYSGSSTIDNAVIHAPYIPLQIMSVSTSGWTQILEGMHARHTLKLSPTGGIFDPLEEATAVMQERFPGEYIVEEDYDVDRLKFIYKLKFKSREDHAIFILTYGDK